MPLCNNCENVFPNRAVVNGKFRNLQRRKFCLECSPFGLHNTKPDLNRKTKKETGTYKYVKNRRRKIKEMAVEYKGGSCIVCGYNKCNQAFDFHHLEPGKKDFAISANLNKSWDTIKKELDKCVLLCSNCHREYHAGIIDLP